jgi:oligopeptide transport system substrate-binding protein
MNKTKLLQSMLLASTLAAASFTPQVLAADVPAGTKLADVQEFIRHAGSEPGSIDPQKIEGTVGANIVRDLFEGLLNQTADGDAIAGVATSWSANDDNTVFTFNLRKDAKWSNGDSVTAHDFVYGWQRAVDPATASPYSWFVDIAQIVNASNIISGDAAASELGVRAVDDFTFEVTLEGPVPFFTKMVVHGTLFPAHQATIEAHGDKWTQPQNIVSNGAYKLTNWKVNERMDLERNTHYWDNNKTVVDKVTFLPIESESASLARYRAGEMDIVDSFPSDQLKTLRKEIGDEVYTTPRLCTYYYIMNVEKAPFDDVRVRKALSYAINRDIITDHILGAGQLPAYGLTPEITNNFSPKAPAYAKMTQSERNDAAAKLLAEAGYTDANPLKLDLLYNTSESHKKIAIAISQMWKQAIPVETTLENQEWKTYLSTRNEGNFSIARAGWCGDYNEASTFLDLLGEGDNDGRYVNQEYIDLMKTAKTMADPSVNYNRAEEILATDMPIIPIYQYTFMKLIKPYIGGFAHANPEENVYSKDVYIKAH